MSYRAQGRFHVHQTNFTYCGVASFISIVYLLEVFHISAFFIFQSTIISYLHAHLSL